MGIFPYPVSLCSIVQVNALYCTHKLRATQAYFISLRVGRAWISSWLELRVKSARAYIPHTGCHLPLLCMMTPLCRIEPSAHVVEAEDAVELDVTLSPLGRPSSCVTVHGSCEVEFAGPALVQEGTVKGVHVIDRGRHALKFR